MRRPLRAGTALERVASACLRHSRETLAVVAALAVIGLGLAFFADFTGSIGKLVDGDDSTAQATADLHRDFGDEPITIRVHGKLTGMLLTRDLGTMLGLEGCLAGNIPKRAKPPAPVCGELAREKPMQVVYGPATFVNEAAGRFLRQLGLERSGRDREARLAAGAARKVAAAQGLSKADQENAARSARQLVYSKFGQSAYRLALKYGLTSVPALNNPDFVLQLVFAPRLGGEVPKPRFAYVFPDKDTALIQARLRPDLRESQRRHAIELVREAVSSDKFSLKYGRYSVSGIPLVVSAAGGRAEGALAIAGLLAVALLLGLARLWDFGPRWIVAPALAAGATAILLGLVAILGIDLSAFSVAFAALVPALGTGLVMRFRHGLGDQSGGGAAAARAFAAVLPAGLVAGAGFAALLLSPAPGVVDLGGLVVIGLLLLLAVTLTAGAPAIWSELPRRARRVARLPAGGAARAAASAATVWARMRAASLRRPGIALLAGLALALLGWFGGAQLEPGRSLERQLPGGADEVRDAAALRADTGAAGDVSVLVRAADVSDPSVLRWMAAYQTRVARRHGWRPNEPCQRADLCPALSLTGLFNGQTPRTRKQARALVRALPQGFSQNAVAADRTAANMAFTVRDMPVVEQHRLFDDMRSQLDPPPPVEARLAGALVEQADSGADLEQARWWLMVAALLAVGLVTLAACGTRRLVGMAPLALATGWAWLAAWALGVPLDPLSAALGAAVVAVAAQPALALQRQAAAGEPPGALSFGRVEALAASAALIGFVALVAAGPRTLRDFGLAGAAGVLIALAGVSLLAPAAIAWWERVGPLRVPRRPAEAVAALRLRLARRAR